MPWLNYQNKNRTYPPNGTAFDGIMLSNEQITPKKNERKYPAFFNTHSYLSPKIQMTQMIGIANKGPATPENVSSFIHSFESKEFMHAGVYNKWKIKSVDEIIEKTILNKQAKVK